jgi:hypothetical protein
MNRFMAQFYQLPHGLTGANGSNSAVKIYAGFNSIFRSGIRPEIQIIEFLRAAGDSVRVGNSFLSILISILYELFLKFPEFLGSGIA